MRNIPSVWMRSWLHLCPNVNVNKIQGSVLKERVCMRRGIKTVGGHKEKRGFGRRNKSKPRNKKLVNYYNFKQQGHIEKNCPKLKHTGEGESRSTNMANTDDSDYYNEEVDLSVSCSQLIGVWIIDFRCS